MNELNRRQVLTLLGVGAACVLASCGSATPASALTTPDPSTTPAVPTSAPTASLGTPTMAAGQALLGIPANPTFTFSKAQDNTGTGETSPILAASWLGHYLVTNAQYLTFAQATGHPLPGYWTGGRYPDGKDNHPVLFVSRADAQAYCAWLNGEQQTDLHLPPPQRSRVGKRRQRPCAPHLPVGQRHERHLHRQHPRQPLQPQRGVRRPVPAILC